LVEFPFDNLLIASLWTRISNTTRAEFIFVGGSHENSEKALRSCRERYVLLLAGFGYCVFAQCLPTCARRIQWYERETRLVHHSVPNFMLLRILEILRQISVHSQETAKLCSEMTAILETPSNNSVVPRIGNTNEISQLEFLPHNVVMCNGLSYSFTPQTYLLLKNFCETEKFFLSKEDVRQDVCFDDDAKNGTIDACICRARRELSSENFPYEIETRHGKGYQLILCKKPYEIT
jgi:hypothetical protein